MGNNTAPGDDKLPADWIKHLNVEGMNKLLRLFKLIYDSGKFPLDFVRSIFYHLPKKRNAKPCDKHRVISVTRHAAKMFSENYVASYTNTAIGNEISDFQMGFKSGMGTREAIFTLTCIFERSLANNQKVYACFIDYQKAFNSLNHDQPFDALEKVPLDTKLLNIIEHIYVHQEAAIISKSGKTGWVPIKKGVR